MKTSTILASILPEARTVRERRLVSSKKCFSSENASALYEHLKLSLLDVNHWNQELVGLTVKASLADRQGRRAMRRAQTGDRIKIMLPPLQAVLRIGDWFEIYEIEERLTGTVEYFFMTIGLSVDPGGKDSEQDVYACLPHVSTATFVISRDETRIELEIYSLKGIAAFQGNTLRTRTENLIKYLFIRSGFYNRIWGKLLRSLLHRGMAGFTNLN